MKFVVSGGRGFIGSHFVDLALRNGHDVIDIDKMTYAANEVLPWETPPPSPSFLSGGITLTYLPYPGTYKLIKKDIKDLEHLPSCDVVVNFAAESHVDNSIEAPRLFVQSNVLGTHNLLELVRGKNYQRPLFVQISTDEVYGDVRLPNPDDLYDENEALAPSNPYSASKAAAEMLVMAHGRTFGLDYIITRSSNNYGPRQYEEKLIARAIQCLRDGTKIPLHGDGTYVRDWLYVEDNVKAIMMLIEQRKLGIWNIAAQNALSNIEVVTEVCSWFDKTFDESVEYVENRMGQDARYAICTNKIENETTWQPEHTHKLFNFPRGI